MSEETKIIISKEGGNELKDFIKHMVLDIYENDNESVHSQKYTHICKIIAEYVHEIALEKLENNTFDNIDMLYSDNIIEKMIFTKNLLFDLIFSEMNFLQLRETDDINGNTFMKFINDNLNIYIEKFSEVMYKCNKIFPRFIGISLDDDFSLDNHYYYYKDMDGSVYTTKIWVREHICEGECECGYWCKDEEDEE